MGTWSVVRSSAEAARKLAVVAIVGFVLAACSSESDRLSGDLVMPTQLLVADRAAAASVDLGEADAECVARRLTDEQANALASAIDDPGLSSDLSKTLSHAILDCVDADRLIRSASAPFTIGASEASIDCVAGKLNAALTERLIAANLEGIGLPAAHVELELASALGLCLEPEELLDRG